LLTNIFTGYKKRWSIFDNSPVSEEYVKPTKDY